MINVISGISLVGVTVGTMALIVVLSVFNGFDNLVRSLFNAFDPDIRITLTEGKTFPADDPRLEKIREHPGVLYAADVLEENALLKYGEKQYIATVKGVSDEFLKMSGIDSMIIDGKFILWDRNMPCAVIGQGIGIYLSVGLNFITPIQVYVPKRTGNVTLNPEQAFNRNYIFPSGIFAIQQDFDSKYIIVPIEFIRNLLEYDNEITSLELKVNPAFSETSVQNELAALAGEKYKVQNRFQQQELLYRIMRSEKWAIFMILAFILLVASFNIIGSLTMLILDKKKDIAILQSLGTEMSRIRKIFFIEGWLISAGGATVGLILGGIICWIQQTFGLIRLKGSGSFVVDTYPVDMLWTDFIFVFLTVLLIGFFAAWYPVRYITRRYLHASE
ncbi:MAG TPA: ABC transporter permease [Bacteroidetes bacterium]|nr:ABC transporter permease [Bacteroidota bacterium]